jgi:hypothetical protein
MKFYIANGRYFTTQAAAKKESKEFIDVDVPTKQGELADYLNDLLDSAGGDVAPAAAPEPVVVGVDFDVRTEFGSLPLSVQLDLAVSAIDAAGAFVRSPLSSPPQVAEDAGSDEPEGHDPEGDEQGADAGDFI